MNGGGSYMKAGKKMIVIFFLLILCGAGFGYFQYHQNKEIYRLISILKDTESKQHWEAVKDLEKIGKPAIRPLLLSFKYDSNLVKFKALKLVEKAGAGKYVKDAIPAYQKKSTDFRNSIITILGTIDDGSVKRDMIKALKDDDPRIRRSAIEYLLVNGEENDNILVIKLLEDPDEETRDAAIKFLGVKREKRAVRHLTKLLQSPNKEIIKNAVCSLIMIGDKNSVKPITNALFKNYSLDISSQFLQELNRISRGKAEDIILKALNKGDKQTKINALSYIRYFGTLRSNLALINFIEDPDPDIQEELSSLYLYVGYTENRQIKEKIAKALNNKNPEVRINAIRILNESENPEKFEILIRHLRDNNSQVRLTTIYALEKVRDKRTVRYLFPLVNDKNTDVRREAVELLAKLGDKRMAPYLFKMLKEKKYHGKETDLELYDKEKLIYLLLRLGEEDAIEPFLIHLNHLAHRKYPKSYDISSFIKDLKQLKTKKAREIYFSLLCHKNSEIQTAAIRVLKDFNIPKTDEILIDIIEKTKDSGVKFTAIEELCKRGNTRYRDYLYKLLDSTDYSTKQFAAGQLLVLKDEKIMEMLRKLVANNEIYVSNSILYSIIRNKDKKNIPLLLYLLDNKTTTRDIRRRIITELGERKVEKAAGKLIEYLECGDMQLQAAAARSLGNIGDKRACEPLIKLSKSWIPYIKVSAIESLGKLKCKKASRIMLKNLNHWHYHLRNSSIIALGEIKEKRAVKPLIEALKFDCRGNNNQAAIALGKIGDKRALKHLREAISQPDINLRIDSAAGLILLGYEDEGLKVLSESLKNKSCFSRSFVVKALQYSKSNKAQEMLITCLKDESGMVRYDAADILSKIGTVKAIPHLETALKDKDSDVRENAKKAIESIREREKKRQYK